MADRPLSDLQRRALRGLVELEAMEEDRRWREITAQDVGYFIDLERVRRAGNGAVKGSWSGYVAPGFSLASTMRSLVARGLVHASSSGRERYVAAYRTTVAGREADKMRCPDGGACHHGCEALRCFRVDCCEPLTASGWETWPPEVREKYGEPVG